MSTNGSVAENTRIPFQTWYWIYNNLVLNLQRFEICVRGCVYRLTMCTSSLAWFLSRTRSLEWVCRTRTNSQFRKIAFTNCQLMLCASSLERFLSIKYVATALCQLVCVWETTHSCIFLFMHVPRTRPRTCDTTRSSVRHDSVCLHLFVAVWVFISCAMENDRDVLLLVFTTYWVE